MIEARLMRRFDPAMAWSEAINRACAAKKIARTSIFTGYQEQAFCSAAETSLRALRTPNSHCGAAVLWSPHFSGAL